MSGGGWGVTATLQKHKSGESKVIMTLPRSLRSRYSAASINICTSPKAAIFLPIIPLNNNPRRDSVAVCNLPQLTTLALQALSRLSALQPLICTDSKTGKPALIKLAALKKNFKKLKDCANLFLDSI